MTTWSQQTDGVWTIETQRGQLVGSIRETAGAYEARVLRHPTGPSPGPDPEVSNGPRVFHDRAAAMAYVEANVGLGPAERP